jgi:hypothetical protein
MRVGIVGSRNYSLAGIDLIRKFINSLPTDTVIVSGGCPQGPDRWAEGAAKMDGYESLIFPADWVKHGRGAGFIRNQTIVDNSDRIVAYWDGKSNGTMDTVRKARKKGIPVTIIGPDGQEMGE